MLLQNLKLGAKFNLLLAATFLIGLLLSSAALSQVLDNRARGEVTTRASILIQSMSAVRNYTDARIFPLLKPRLETEPTFISEAIPAFSANEVFQRFRENSEYKDFFYKEATLNPTNLRDKADPFEAEIVERFRREPNTKEISGFRDLPGGKIYYIAHPLAVKRESCLECHTTPSRAPKSQVVTYGSEGGYGWNLNEIVTAQIVMVPASEVINNAGRSLMLVMAILTAIFLLLLLLINTLMRRAVIRPIRRIANAAEAVSKGQMDVEFEQNSRDEIGALAAAFNRMKSSLEISMNLLNKRKKP